MGKNQHPSYSEDELLSHLRQAAALEPRLTLATYGALARERGWAHFNTIRSQFGSWNRALAAAGVRPARMWGARPCSRPDCEDPVYARELCSPHYLEHMEEHGHDYAATSGGYVFVHVVGQRSMREQRAVMEATLGRPLLPGESVHHKGSLADNRPTQLELRIGAHAQGWAVDEAVAWAREILARYDSR